MSATLFLKEMTFKVLFASYFDLVEKNTIVIKFPKVFYTKDLTEYNSSPWAILISKRTSRV